MRTSRTLLVAIVVGSIASLADYATSQNPRLSANRLCKQGLACNFDPCVLGQENDPCSKCTTGAVNWDCDTELNESCSSFGDQPGGCGKEINSTCSAGLVCEGAEGADCDLESCVHTEPF